MKCTKLFVLVFLVIEGVAALPAPPQGLLRPEDTEPRFVSRKATDESESSNGEAMLVRDLKDLSPDLASSAWVTRATQEDDDTDTAFQREQRFVVRQLIQRDDPALDRRQRNRKGVVIGTLLGLGGLGAGGYFAFKKLLQKEKGDDRKQQQQQQPLPDDPSYHGSGCSPTGVGCRRDVTDNERHDLEHLAPDLASSALVARAGEQGDDTDAAFQQQRFLVRRMLQSRSEEEAAEDSNLDRRQHSRKNILIGSILGLGALGTGGYFFINRLLKDKKERDRKKQQEQEQQFLPEDPSYSEGGCRRDVTDRMMASDEQGEGHLTARTARSWRPGPKTFAAGGLLTLAGLGLASYLGYKALNPGSKGQNQPPQFGQGPPPRRRDLAADEADGSALEEKRDGAYLAVRC